MGFLPGRREKPGSRLSRLRPRERASSGVFAAVTPSGSTCWRAVSAPVSRPVSSKAGSPTNRLDQQAPATPPDTPARRCRRSREPGLGDASPHLDVSRADRSGIRLSGLYVYPIKSCGGVALEEWDVEERGLRHDRR